MRGQSNNKVINIKNVYEESWTGGTVNSCNAELECKYAAKCNKIITADELTKHMDIC